MRFSMCAAGLGLGLGLAACQSGRLVYPTGIYSSAAAFRRGQPSVMGEQAGRVFLQRRLYTKTAGAPRTRVPLADAWGYADARGQAVRLFQQQTFLVEQVDSLVVYSHLDYRLNPAYISTPTPYQPTKVYYFSRGLNGPVQLLTLKKLRRSFADQAAFLRLLDQYHRPLATTSGPPAAPPSFQVVALYQLSLSR